MNAIKDIRESEQTEAEPEAAASVPARTSQPPVAGTRVLGLTRWVQYVFVLVAAFVLWLANKLIVSVWQNWAEPNEVVATIVSAAIALAVAVGLYRNEKSHRVVAEVVGELAKVTWPSRKETYASTIIVVVTSIIAAAIIGSFDFVWSAITDLLYKYKV